MNHLKIIENIILLYRVTVYFRLLFLFFYCQFNLISCNWFSTEPVYPADANNEEETIIEDFRDMLESQDIFTDEAENTEYENDQPLDEIFFQCRNDFDCNDHEPCNGNETCIENVCYNGQPLPENSYCIITPEEPGICINGICSPFACGDGILEPGEECDNESAFCVNCKIAPPSSDWHECEISSGNKVFFKIEDITTPHSLDNTPDYCKNLIEDLIPFNFLYYGAIIIKDPEIWQCISPLLNQTTDYIIGLRQDRSSPDYSEPAGGFYWRAYDGSQWLNIAPLGDPPDYFLPLNFDNTGGTGAPFDCCRLKFSNERWEIWDYSCPMTVTFPGICMITFR